MRKFTNTELFEMFNIECSPNRGLELPLLDPLWPTERQKIKQKRRAKRERQFIDFMGETVGTPGSKERIEALRNFYADEVKLNGPIYDKSRKERQYGESAFTNDVSEQLAAYVSEDIF